MNNCCANFDKQRAEDGMGMSRMFVDGNVDFIVEKVKMTCLFVADAKLEEIPIDDVLLYKHTSATGVTLMLLGKTCEFSRIARLGQNYADGRGA